jgi:hypothetical protein
MIEVVRSQVAATSTLEDALPNVGPASVKFPLAFCLVTYPSACSEVTSMAPVDPFELENKGEKLYPPPVNTFPDASTATPRGVFTKNRVANKTTPIGEYLTRNALKVKVTEPNVAKRVPLAL